MRFLITILFSVLLLGHVTTVHAASHPWSFSPKDYRIAKKASQLARKGRWNQMKSTLSEADDPVVRNIFTWLYFVQTNDTNFSGRKKFIDDLPHWPKEGAQYMHAEYALDEKNSPKETINWFARPYYNDKKGPHTVNGRIRLAEALLATSKQTVDVRRAKELIREAFILSDYGTELAKHIYSKHRKFIDDSAQVARADRMLLDRKYDDFKKQLALVPDADKKLLEVRFLLATGKSGVDKAIKELSPKDQRDPGLALERMRWRATREKYNVEDLIDNVTAPKEGYQVDPWWHIKRLFIRPLVVAKDYKSAYKLASTHGATSDGTFAEAEWLAGWIALRYLNDPQQAYKHFYPLYKEVHTPISKARAAYWAGRAAEANNNGSISQKWYKVGSGYPMTFYGQLSTAKRGQDRLLIPHATPVTKDDVKSYERNELVKAALLLNQLNRHFEAKQFLYQAIDNARTLGEKKLIVAFGNEVNRPDYTILLHKKSMQTGAMFAEYGYPLLPEKYRPTLKSSMVPELPLVHAITYQESYFQPQISSPVGAQGLMQLMPATAKAIAKELGLKHKTKKLTENPQYNVTLGSYYLNKRIKEFDGSYILAIAAYNAGKSNSNRWIEMNGDPRKMKDPDDVIDWMERITYAETRNYVQRVLEHTQIYRYLLANEKNRSHKNKIVTDIMR